MSHSVLANPQFVQAVDDSAHQMVGVLDVGLQRGLALAPGLPAVGVKLRWCDATHLVAIEVPRAVRQAHWEVDQERLVLVTFREVEDEIGVDVGTIVLVRRIELSAVADNGRMPIPGRATREISLGRFDRAVKPAFDRVMHADLVEAVFLFRTAKLPLAANGGTIAGLLK